VHVNIALILKFMPNYLFNPQPHEAIPRMDQPHNDDFLFDQGPTRALSKVVFHDYREAYADRPLPNVQVFTEQIEALRELVMQAPPDEDQRRDTDLLLTLGDLFTLVVYGQLALEGARIDGISDDVVDQIFAALVQDASELAIGLHGKASTTADQQRLCLALVRKPAVDAERYARVWDEVHALDGAYELSAAGAGAAA